MVYRLGERARFYKVRHVWRRGQVRLAVLAVLCAMLSGIIMLKFVPNYITHALALGTHRPSLARAPASSSQVTHAGSSAPAPKGTSKGATQETIAAATSLHTVNCNGFPAAHSGLFSSTAPELRKLAQYEQLCGGAVAQRTSFFVPTPSSVAQAQIAAKATVAKLRAYVQAGISPIVFMEPTDLNGSQLDLSRYENGDYDPVLTAYFQALQSADITAAEMGMWVYLPEGNIPVWTTTDPSVFTAVITKMAQMQKQYFPGSQVGMLLDSESYRVGASWGNGQYVSLLPYVQNMPKGLIDSFGMEGFPWVGPANRPDEGSLYNPAVYLRTDLAIQAARALGVNNIWFNTGTFAEMYAGKPEQTVTNTPLQRQQMLESVLRLAHQVKVQGFTVSVHLFAQNKSSWTEATDWSYWTKEPGDRTDTSAFTAFAHDARTAGIPVWLYDSE